ncbi:HNH endonuclease [Brachybacterium phenoliresistens]|uniref:HNH endonuclease n=1 Tax=Brachybacterium phenoliresistens TaxID=396014 RepID=Z9JY65_9MICO|nr:RNA-guided endonuclease IscB [Brachybacterium phenoliresistens]EWS82737.1 HNH endonuclease [Brachybacterium phenoliresistens]
MLVLDRRGKPLMPTTPRRARQLLRSGRARVHRVQPFVLRIVDRRVEDSETEPLVLGIDPGFRHTGVALAREQEVPDPRSGRATTIRHGLFLLRVDHRGAVIRDRLSARSALRRGRRSRKLRYRAPRFDNRARAAGWLAPSIRHRAETTVTWARRLAAWAPVTRIDLEVPRFDARALHRADAAVGDRGQGTLHGTEVREYVLERDGRTCVYCGASGLGAASVPLTLDHVRARAHGGPDAPANLVAACVPCNRDKGDREVEEYLARRPAVLARVRRSLASVVQQDLSVSVSRSALCRALQSVGPEVRTHSGGRTKWNRSRAGLPWDHVTDALCVGRVDAIASLPALQHVAVSMGRGSYSRTRMDRYGFPRLRLTRRKMHHGLITGDLVRAVVPSGRRAGTHVGRVAVRASGSCNITTARSTVQHIGHRHITVLQRGDGYRHLRAPVALAA